jgi:hypothetical protein
MDKEALETGWVKISAEEHDPSPFHAVGYMDVLTPFVDSKGFRTGKQTDENQENRFRYFIELTLSDGTQERYYGQWRNA